MFSESGGVCMESSDQGGVNRGKDGQTQRRQEGSAQEIFIGPGANTLAAAMTDIVAVTSGGVTNASNVWRHMSGGTASSKMMLLGCTLHE